MAIPVENPTPGTVAVIVRPDGTEEVVKRSIPGQDVLNVTMEESTQLKIVDNTKEFQNVAEDIWYADSVAFTTSREELSLTNFT